jgi:hypothetical protein
MSDDHASCHTMSCTAAKQAFLQGIGLSCDPSPIPGLTRGSVCRLSYYSFLCHRSRSRNICEFDASIVIERKRVRESVCVCERERERELQFSDSWKCLSALKNWF